MVCLAQQNRISSGVDQQLLSFDDSDVIWFSLWFLKTEIDSIGIN